MSTTGHHASPSDTKGEVEKLRRRVASLSEVNRRLRRRERLLRTAVDRGGVGWWTFDPVRRTVDGSAAFKSSFGLADGETLDYDALLSRVHPEDRSRRDAIMAESLATGGDYELEYRVVWPNGEERALEVRGAPIYGVDRRVTGLAGVSVDVTGRRRSDAHNQLVRDELNHRLKNCMTMVQALASQTLRTSDSAESFRASFGARLEALGRSLSLTEGQDEPTTLRGVLARALEPYIEASAERFALAGPEVTLPPRAATALGLAFHELATNAMKYGAISNDVGRVLVGWTAEDGEVELVWREVGGPAVSPPSRRGFGSRLVERAAPLELHGRATLAFEPEGLVCRIAFPLPD